jgi:RNA-directed DNA polymerase
MHERGKSDRPVVPAKSPNKAARRAAEAAEERGLVLGNTDQQNALRTQSREGAPSALDRVREHAAKDKNARFTALLHHVTIDLLRTSFLSLQRSAAPGVDGVTWEQYQVDMEDRLQDLHNRLHRGVYRAKPSRRVFIAKPDGRERPLGIASLEDKVVQRAVTTVLNAIYEKDFLGFSYGFRPGRSAHQALDALSVGILRRKVNWVLDADISGFFDAISREWLVRFLKHRIADRRIVHLIQKWLGAGVLHGGVKTVGATGSPQGATISPLLANVYLHYVFDLWTEQWRRRHARGDMIACRYADDFVLGFEHEMDARRFWAELRHRMAKFGLELHPEKTRLLRFGRHASQKATQAGEGKPGTFDFLGLTHISGKSRKGKFLLARLTSKPRMRRSLQVLREQLRLHRHRPIPEQGAWLRRVLQGYFNYYAVPTNSSRIRAFRAEVTRAWMHALRRRSQRHRMTWKRMRALEARWLPPARVLHPWPDQRFDARTQGGSPVR